MGVKAVGVIRVSQPHGREGEKFSSPRDQRAAIDRLCQANGWQLVAAHDEMKVSGNALLEDRPGLSQAVTAILAGSASVLVADTTERLWWNHEVRAQVLRLIAAADGEVWSADEGRLSNGTAADEFSGTVRTAADRFTRQQNAEKCRRAVERAVKRGVVPWKDTTPGYDTGEDGRLMPNADAPVVAEAFRLRASGATVAEVRAFLRERGIERSYHGVTHLLKSRVVLGEIHFGGLANPEAHLPIVDRETWQRVQRVRVTRGRRAKSERLLARLGVLRCGSCGARMVVGSAHHGEYALYRCPPTGDCKRRVTISAELVEGTVVEAVRSALADVEGRASAEENAREAAAALERAQEELNAAIRAFKGLDGEAAARERLAELRDARDAAQERAEQLGDTGASLTINAADDWDRLSLDAQRALIRAVVERVVVHPGRGTDRVRVELVGE